MKAIEILWRFFIDNPFLTIIALLILAVILATSGTLARLRQQEGSALKKISHYFQKISELGLKNEAHFERRRIILTNQFAIVTFGIALMAFTHNVLFYNKHAEMALSMMMVSGSLSLIGGAVLFLNARNHHYLARCVFLLGPFVYAMSTCWMIGSEQNGHLALFFVVLLAFMLFDQHQFVTGAFFGILAMVCYVYAGFYLTSDVAMFSLEPDVAKVRYFTVTSACFFGLFLIIYIFHGEITRAENMLTDEFNRSENLLLNILPEPIANRLKKDTNIIADRLPEVSVIFVDIAGFTPLSNSMEAEKLVELLNSIFVLFDKICKTLGIEKIKTIGDAYMAVAGAPTPREDHHIIAAEAAILMREAAKTILLPNGKNIEVRIGIHTGPAVAGVIGSHKFAFDLWGDTVNTASRMESHGEIGKIHISEHFNELVQSSFTTAERGEIEVKGKGPMNTWWLFDRKE